MILYGYMKNQIIFDNLKKELLSIKPYIINIKLEKKVGKQINNLTSSQRYKLLKIRARIFKYIKNPTNKEILYAIDRYQGIKHLSSLFDEEFKKKILRINPYYISDFHNPSETLQSLAINQDYKLILAIGNPSLRLIKKVLRKDSNIIIDLINKIKLDESTASIAFDQNPYLLCYIDAKYITLEYLQKYFKRIISNGMQSDYTIIYNILKLKTVDSLILNYLYCKITDSKLKEKIKKHKSFKTEAQLIMSHFNGCNNV